VAGGFSEILLQKKCRMTDYYEIHAGDYHDKTVAADPSIFFIPLCTVLPPQPRILDIGCGSGRDLLWLNSADSNPPDLNVPLRWRR